MTSSAHDADLKRNDFRRTIHSQSFIAVAFIFSELDGGGGGGASGEPPWSRMSNKSPVWIGLRGSRTAFVTSKRHDELPPH